MSLPPDAEDGDGRDLYDHVIGNLINRPYQSCRILMVEAPYFRSEDLGSAGTDHKRCVTKRIVLRYRKSAAGENRFLGREEC